MNDPEVKTICVVGAGNMGHQIALTCAIAGYQVWCTDRQPAALEKALQFVESYLPERVRKGRLSEEQAVQAKSNLIFTESLEEAASTADFVIEAVLENLELKQSVFRELDQLCPPHTILATNSSFIVSSKLAPFTNRPSQVINMHFFNPALVMKCVEVVKGAHVSQETAEITMKLATSLGKNPVLLHREIYGFLVNRILSALKTEALYLLDQGIASAEDIDQAVTDALGHPMGPFRLMDLTGIDLSYHISMERFRETGDPALKPSPTVVEKYVKREWGRKTGKGFYEYSVENQE